MAMNRNYINPGAITAALVLVGIALCLEGCSCCCSAKIAQVHNDDEKRIAVLGRMGLTLVAGIFVVVAAFLANSAKGDISANESLIHAYG